MQTIGWDNGNELHNATCVETQTWKVLKYVDRLPILYYDSNSEDNNYSSEVILARGGRYFLSLISANRIAYLYVCRRVSLSIIVQQR